MKRYYPLALLVLVALVVAASGMFKRGQGWAGKKHANLPPKAGESAGSDHTANAPTGTRRKYRFSYVASGEYAMEGGSKVTGKLAMSLAGTLSTLVVASGGDGRTLEMQLDPSELDSGQMPTSISASLLKSELGKPFSVSYAKDGAVRGVAFPAPISHQTSTLLRDIVSQFQVTLRPGPAWVAVESEPGGECLVSFKRMPAQVVSKQKLRFVRVARDGKLVTPEETVGVPTFLASSADYEMAADGTVIEAKIHHKMGAKIEVVDGSATSEVSAEFTRIEEGKEAAPLARVQPTFRALNDGPSDQGAQEASERLPPVKELVATMARAGQASDFANLHQAQSQLSRAIARDPSLLSELTAKGADQPLLSAIGAAGSPEAQAELARLATDPKQPVDARRQAIDAFHEVAEGTSESVDTLMDLAEKDGDVRENALLAVGGLLNRRRAEDPDGSAGFVGELAARYERAGSDVERMQLLDALGNSGDAAAFEVIEAALGSPVLALRVAAAKNLRLLPAPRADELLTPLILGASEAELRAAALFAASFRRFEGMRGALDKLMREEPNAELRALGLNALLTYLRRDGAAEAAVLVRWVAENDSNEELREQARRGLAQA